MKQLGCRDLGGNCDFVARGATDDEIKKKLMAHAEKDHKDMFKSPDMKKQMMTRVDTALRNMKPAPAGR